LEKHQNDIRLITIYSETVDELKGKAQGFDVDPWKMVETNLGFTTFWIPTTSWKSMYKKVCGDCSMKKKV